MNDFPGWLKELGRTGLPVLAIATGLTYGFLRFAYIQFYSLFGVDPEEVGLGRIELLSQALVGPATIAITYATSILIVMLAIFLSISAMVVREERRLRRRSEGQEGQVPGQPRRTTYYSVQQEGLIGYTRTFILESVSLKLVAMIGLFAVLFAAYFVISDARSSANDVRKQGQTVMFPRFNLYVISIPTVQIRALPVSVSAKSLSELPAPLRSGTKCMLYLGRANNTALIYDVANRRTIRIPTENLSISVDLRKRQLDSVCRPPPPANDERSLG